MTGERPAEVARTAKGRATRERIIRAAAQVLLSQGLSGFHLDRVRQAASISGSQLSHYFADRQALIRAVVDRQMDLMVQFYRQPALNGLQTIADYEVWAQLSVRWLGSVAHRESPAYHSLAGQLSKSDEVTRATLAAGYWRWADTLEQSFTGMVHSGVLRPPASPRQLAMVLMAGQQGGSIVAVVDRDSVALLDACRFVVNHIRVSATDPRDRRARSLPPRLDTHADRIGLDHTPEHFTVKGLATRARIVRGAADLMYQHGVHRTSLEAVRTHADVSGSQLANYFGSKRELIRQVIALRAHEVLALQRQPTFGPLDSVESLKAWAAAHIGLIDTLYVRGGCTYGSLAGELLEADDGMLDDLAAGYDAWMALLHQGLSAMHDRGVLEERADPRHLATALLVAHQGGALLTHTVGTAEPFRVAVSAAVDYVVSFSRRT